MPALEDISKLALASAGIRARAFSRAEKQEIEWPSAAGSQSRLLVFIGAKTRAGSRVSESKHPEDVNSTMRIQGVLSGLLMD